MELTISRAKRKSNRDKKPINKYFSKPKTKIKKYNLILEKSANDKNQKCDASHDRKAKQKQNKKNGT